MPVCTSCKHNREIERLRNICAACAGPSSDFGRNAHIGANTTPEAIMRHADMDKIAQSRANTATRINVADETTAELLMRVVQEFATLSDAEAPIVAHRLRGQENWQIAHEMRLSKAVVWERWDGLKKRNPIWGALDNGLIGKRKGGRKPEARPTNLVQDDLFDGTQPQPQTDN